MRGSKRTLNFISPGTCMVSLSTSLVATMATLVVLSAAAEAGMLDAAPTVGTANQTFLTVGEAFKVRWQWTTPGQAVGTYTVAPGYYLYRNRLRISAGEPASLKLGTLDLPAGDVKDDPYAGRQEVYHHSFTATQALSLPPGLHGPVEIQAVWQGCAEAGLCYPPVRQTFRLDPPSP